MEGSDFIIYTIALIVIGILLFELIVFIHEFGHFITAKKCGVQVNEFALGMGPKLIQFKKGETLYTLRLFPIGGFCSMEGEDTESDSERAFGNKPVWQRMIVVVAGAFNNIVLGLIMMMILLVQSPYFSSTTVSSFSQAAFTSKSGMQVGDQITDIGGYPIYCSRDISFAVAMLELQIVDGDDFSIYKEDCGFTLVRQYSSLKAEDYTDDELNAITAVFNDGIEKLNVCTTKQEADSITAATLSKVNELSGVEYTPEKSEYMAQRKRFRTDVTVLRDGDEVTLENVDFYTYLGDNDTPTVALDFSVTAIEKNVGTLISESFKSTVSVVRMIWKSLYGLVTGTYGMNDIAGPVGAASVVTQAAQVGLESSFGDAVNNILYMMMIITVNLGIVNLLPLPALDGGRLLFMIIELIRRKPVPAKYEGWVHAAGFLILLGFIVVVTFNDIIRLVTGSGMGG